MANGSAIVERSATRGTLSRDKRTAPHTMPIIGAKASHAPDGSVAVARISASARASFSRGSARWTMLSPGR